MNATLRQIEYYLPEAVLTNSDLREKFPDWEVDKIASKTGIEERHIAGAGECSSDLAVSAAQRLFATRVVSASKIDYVILCTQTPDYLLPPTACLVQDRLGISQSAGAFDFNLGSSGYVYGLGLAQGLVASQQASNILLLTADTYSKIVHDKDKSVRMLFGDAATASWVSCSGVGAGGEVGSFVYGTNGAGAQNLIVPAGGMRLARSLATGVEQADLSGNIRSADNLYMNGSEIFNFTLDVVPGMIGQMLEKSQLKLADVDLFVFHQANAAMLEHLRKRMKIQPERFFVHLAKCGNTVSSTIPIALREAQLQNRVIAGMKVMLVGFGVGYSWGATMLQY